MIDAEFCSYLEYALSKELINSTDEQTKGFWCDGVLLPMSEENFSKKYVNDNKKIIMSAFVGKSGQDQYKLILNFGSKALSKYARGLNILDCVPIEKKDKWFIIDVKNQRIEILLD